MVRIALRAQEIAEKEGLPVLVRKLCLISLWGLFGRVLVHPMMRDFRKRADCASTVEEVLDFVFSYSYLGARVTPMHVRDELMELLKLVESSRPKVVLDIGTAWGGSIFAFTKIATSDAVLVTVDLPGRLWGYSCPSWMGPLVMLFARESQSIVLVRGDSHSDDTFTSVRNSVPVGGVDFLFIDGDHSYNGVRQDFEMYSKLVREGGVIAFHDICEGDKSLVGGVPRFWREIKRTHSTREIVRDYSQGACGIGVLFNEGPTAR